MPRTIEEPDYSVRKIALAVIGCANEVQEVKTKLEKVDRKLDQVSDRTDAALNLFLGLKKQGDEFRNEVTKRFDEVNHRFDEVNLSFALVDQRFEAMDHRFEAMDHRFAAMDQRLGGIEGLLRDLVNRSAA